MASPSIFGPTTGVLSSVLLTHSSHSQRLPKCPRQGQAGSPSLPLNRCALPARSPGCSSETPANTDVAEIWVTLCVVGNPSLRQLLSAYKAVYLGPGSNPRPVASLPCDLEQATAFLQAWSFTSVQCEAQWGQPALLIPGTTLGEGWSDSTMPTNFQGRWSITLERLGDTHDVPLQGQSCEGAPEASLDLGDG